MLQQTFIFGATYLIFLSLIIGGIYFLKQNWKIKKELFIFGTLTFILIGIFGFLSNHLYINPRPFVVEHFTPLIPHIPDNGFPSDHTLVAFGIATIIFIFNRKLGIVLGLIALFVAISRVYVGLHHSLDVIGSFVIAVVSTYIVYKIRKPQP